MKNKFAFSRFIKILYLRGENCLQNAHFYKQKGTCLENPLNWTGSVFPLLTFSPQLNPVYLGVYVVNHCFASASSGISSHGLETTIYRAIGERNTKNTYKTPKIHEQLSTRLPAIFCELDCAASSLSYLCFC